MPFVIKIRNNTIMKQMRWKNHLFQLLVTRKSGVHSHTSHKHRLGYLNIISAAAARKSERDFMLHFKLHAFIFICFPTYGSARNSSASATARCLVAFCSEVWFEYVHNVFPPLSIIFDVHFQAVYEIFIARARNASTPVKNDISIERKAIS